MADLLLAVLIVLVVQAGVRFGMLRQVCLSGGLLLGFLLAALTQKDLGPLIHEGSFYWLALLLVSVMIVGLCVDVGWSVGVTLERKLEKWQLLESVNQLCGGVIAGITAVLLLWFASALIGRLPNQVVAAQVQQSRILTIMRQNFPNAPELFVQAGNLLNPHSAPTVFADSEPQININSIQTGHFPQAVLERVAASVVKVTGQGCGGIVTGTGFVAATDTVVTNAHVVSGLVAPQITTSSGIQFSTQTILFDPLLDIAILHINTLPIKPLPLFTEVVANNTFGQSLGYASGQLGSGPAVVLSNFQAQGYDIYNANATNRLVYALYDDIQPGDSGGPLVNTDGTVIGVIFAKSSSQAHIGYALTMPAVHADIETALASHRVVSNGQCGSE